MPYSGKVVYFYSQPIQLERISTNHFSKRVIKKRFSYESIELLSAITFNCAINQQISS